MLDYLTKLTNEGYSLIPIKNKEKKPLVSWKDYQKEPAPIEVVEKWFNENPECSWAVVTGKVSGFAVLDCDSREAFDFIKEKGFSKSPTVKTSRGYHVYFKYRDGVKSLQSVAGRKDIQLKSESGYVLIPPSIHASGAKYEWVEGLGIEDVDLAELPAWVFNGAPIEKASIKELYQGCEEGNRNASLARLCGFLINAKFDFDECMAQAKVWNSQNKPPLSDDEVENVVNSIWKRHYENEFPVQEKSSIDLSPPESIHEFLKRDIPSLEFYVEKFLQKSGKTMISAPTNVGKSILVQNLALSLTSKKDLFLDCFDVEGANCLYLDFEMGVSAVQARFRKMIESGYEPDGFFVRSLLGINLLEDNVKNSLKQWIESLGIKIIILDPIGSAWFGNENDKQEVVQVTSFLDTLIEKYEISILLIHHWRKGTKGFVGGGEMAAGSYKWSAWLDNHITLEGPINSLRMSCQKARGTAKFDDIRIGLDPETLIFGYVGDYSKKFTEDDLIEVFENFNLPRVKITELIKKAKQMGKGSNQTVRNLIKDSKCFNVDTKQKAHYLYRKEDIINPIDEL